VTAHSNCQHSEARPMATELVFDAKKGGAIIVIFPNGEFYCNANTDNEGGKLGYALQKFLKDEAWKRRILQRIEDVIDKEEREKEYQKLRDRPTKV